MFSRFFHQVHLWLGLLTGGIAFLLCLSGTLLVAQMPVERWVNQSVQQVTPQGEAQDLAILIPKLQAQSTKSYTAITLPALPTEALILQQGREQTYVNPYSGAVLGGIHQPTRDFFMFWFRLHRWLLLDSDTGRPITGAATVAFLVISLTGLWLWLLRLRKQPGRALRLRFKKVRWRRLNYDLHLVLGFYALIPLLVMAWSGLFWSYRQPFVYSVHRILNGEAPPVTQEKERSSGDRSTPSSPQLTLPYAQLLALVQQQYNYVGDVTLQFPIDSNQVMLSKTPRSHFWSMPVRDRLVADAQTATLIKAEPFENLSPAEKLLGLIKAIHVGTVFGGVSLWIYFFAALIGTSLPLTGALHWAQRTQKRWLNAGGGAYRE
jgi:uncharacterized iron-regulated membrane protein